MSRSALQIVLRRSRINHVHNTVVGTWSRCNLGCAIVSRETCLPLLVDFKVNSTTGCSTHHTCRRDDTCLVCITNTERISQVAVLLGNTQVRILGETCIKEITYIIINLWSSPTVKTCSSILRVVVHTRMLAILLCISIVGITSISSIVGQICNLRTPSHRR